MRTGLALCEARRERQRGVRSRSGTLTARPELTAEPTDALPVLILDSSESFSTKLKRP